MAKKKRKVTSVKIVLPLPHKALSPNGRPHWKTKAAQVQKHRGWAAAAIRSVHRAPQPWGKTLVSVVFFYKQNRRRDEENSRASLKAYLDGVVEARLIVDDDWKHLRTKWVWLGVDKLDPRVELEFEQVDEFPPKPF